ESNGTLMLIGRRQVRSNNSWMHNYRRLMRGKERCTLLMHPDDAERLTVDTGQQVAVVSRTGRIEVPLEVSDEMMPGVVSLPHGWGHDRPGTRLAEASQHPGASLNDLTDELQIDALAGTSVLNGVTVRVEPVVTR
ncbi:MAG: molybdopterin oxidoreductase family protein, partial [Deltaproteobacteria bacterium]|nr:molybdopterin oxidoreductase family protein [Deltaproteobacteria bacterium]